MKKAILIATIISLLGPAIALASGGSDKFNGSIKNAIHKTIISKTSSQHLRK